MRNKFIYNNVSYVVDITADAFNIKLPTGELVTVSYWLESYPPRIGGVEPATNKSLVSVDAVETDLIELIEDLESSFSQLEADHLMQFVHADQKPEAIEFLIENGLTESDALKAYDYFRKEAIGETVDLVEIPRDAWGSIDEYDRSYLVRIGRAVMPLYPSPLGWFVNGRRHVTHEQMRQIWEIVVRQD